MTTRNLPPLPPGWFSHDLFKPSMWHEEDPTSTLFPPLPLPLPPSTLPVLYCGYDATGLLYPSHYDDGHMDIIWADFSHFGINNLGDYSQEPNL